MYNIQYNSWYNYTPSLVGGWSTDEIVFDGFGLQNENIVTNRIDYDNLTSVELNSFLFPRENGWGVLSKFYRGREISLDVTIRDATPDDFSLTLDNAKKNIKKTEGYLDIMVAGEKRRIKATCTKFDVTREHYNITFCKAKIVFTCLEPFFYAASKQSYTFPGKVATFTEEVTNLGSAESLPIFYHIFGATTAVTAVAITAFGKTMTVTNTFVANDILIIDSENKKITKNGSEIDYSGSFPIFPTGSNPFTVTYTGTVAVDVTLLQNKNYL